MKKSQCCILQKLETKEGLSIASKACISSGLLSIGLSLAIWFSGKKNNPQEKIQTQLSAIFIGLWVPSLLALGSHLEKKAQEKNEEEKTQERLHCEFDG